MLGSSVIMGGVPMAFAASVYATRKSPDCSISRTAFHAARLALVGLLVIIVLGVITYMLLLPAVLELVSVDVPV